MNQQNFIRDMFEKNSSKILINCVSHIQLIKKWFFKITFSYSLNKSVLLCYDISGGVSNLVPLALPQTSCMCILCIAEDRVYIQAEMKKCFLFLTLFRSHPQSHGAPIYLTLCHKWQNPFLCILDLNLIIFFLKKKQSFLTLASRNHFQLIISEGRSLSGGFLGAGSHGLLYKNTTLLTEMGETRSNIFCLSLWRPELMVIYWVSWWTEGFTLRWSWTVNKC